MKINNQNLSVLQEADLKGKIVLVRVDHNVVKKGKINDPYRIEATFGTLFYISSRGGKIILMTHVGRPKDKKAGKITQDPDSSVQPIVDYLENKLHLTYKIPACPDPGECGFTTFGDSLKPLIQELKEDKIDGIYLPNTRWFAGEEAKGEEADRFARELAAHADIYVNDAFGSWQAHASTVLVPQYLPAYAGFLMQKELENLERIYHPTSPLVAVVAGAKFDTKVDSLFALLKKADYLVLGGVIYNAYLCAKYGISIKGIEPEDLASAKEFVAFSAQYPDKLIELPYIVESDTLEGKLANQHRFHYLHDLKPGTRLNYVLDAAEQSFKEKNVCDVFLNARTIFVNAVMGLTPHFTEGTIALNRLIAQNKSALKLFGGGDTLQEFKQLLPGLYVTSVDDPSYYLFTGGGAVLKAIETGTTLGLEPVKALIKQT